MSTINDVLIEKFIGEFFAQEGAYENILDLGCGCQPYAKYYAARAKYSIAADYSVRSALTVRLSALALPFRDRSIDVVLFSEVLEHLTEPAVAVAEISRVLKPGGKLVLTTPFLYMMHEIPNDHFRFTAYGLFNLLTKAGLSTEQMEQRGTIFAVGVCLIEFIARGASQILVRIPIVGRIWNPLEAILARCWHFLVSTVYLRVRPGLRIDVHDERFFHGARGQIRLWSLGYCVVAGKSQSA